jgi:hypothetical protein
VLEASVYHFHTAPMPKVPPDTLSVVEPPPEQMLAGFAVAPLGTVDWPLTAIVKLTVVAPAGFLAVTVYAAGAIPVVGVPVIAPVILLSVKPAGSAGDTEKLSTVPVTVTVFCAIATP